MLELQMYEKKDRLSKTKSLDTCDAGMKIVLPVLESDQKTLQTTEEDRRHTSSLDSLSNPDDLLHLHQKQSLLMLEDESKIEEEECSHITSDIDTKDDPQKEGVITRAEEVEDATNTKDEEVNENGKGEQIGEQIAKEAPAEEEKPLERFDMAALLAKIRSSKPAPVSKQESPVNDSDHDERLDSNKNMTIEGNEETEFEDKNTDVHLRKTTSSKKSSKRSSKIKKKNNETIIEKKKEKPSPVEPDHIELDLGSQKWIGKLSLQIDKSPPMTETSVPSLSHIELSGAQAATVPTSNLQRVSFNSISLPLILPKQFPFKLEYSSDLTTWTEYKGRRGKDPVFTHVLDEYVFQLGKEINARYIRVSSFVKDVLQSSTLKAEGTTKTIVRDKPTQLHQALLKTEPASFIRQQTPSAVTETLQKSPPINEARPNPDSARKQRITPLPPERSESSISSCSDQRWGRSSRSSTSFSIIRDNDFDDDDNDNKEDDRTLPSIQGEHVSKFEADLVVNIKKDSTPISRTPIQTIKKKAMFPSLAATPVESGSDTDETAEERRRRKNALNRRHAATQKLEAMKNAIPSQPRTDEDDEEALSGDELFGSNNSAERDFLRKYCIISDEQRLFYKYLYRMYEEDKVDNEPALPIDDALEAISIANNALVTEGMTNYIVTVLRIVGVQIDQRIDVRTFMLLLAFSEKVVSLGDFFRLHLERVDYANLLSCVIRAKQMYRLLLRDDEKKRTIYIEDLLIELQAAHIPHNKGLFTTLTNDKAMMDFLDYLAYFPLFILTHTNIIDSPVL